MPLMDYAKRIGTYYFNRKKIRRSIKTRKGSCKQCGKCCTILGMKCIFLDKNNRCRIYRFRPKILCKIPPLNLTKGEIKKHQDLDCGYYWDCNHPSKKIRK